MHLPPQVAFLTSLEQDSLVVCAIISRLVARHINFTGFSENRLPDRFSPELLKYPILFIDHKAMEQLSSEEMEQLETYARTNIVMVFDHVYGYQGVPADRNQLNFHAEIMVNMAIVYLERRYTINDMPRQDIDATLAIIKEKALSYAETARGINEFTFYAFRALERLLDDKNEYIALLEKFFDPQRLNVSYLTHDPLGGWAFAYRHYQLTGDRRLADRMVELADKVLACRPRTPEGILAGAGIIDDPLGLKNGAFHRYDPNCTTRHDLVYTETLHFHGPFFAACAAYTGKQAYLDEALILMRQIRDCQLDAADGLPLHYSLKGKAGGAKWGRGVAHAVWGADMMLKFYPDMPECYRKEVLDFLDRIGSGLIKTQMDSGLWGNILDVPNSTPETSCTICFAVVYARLKDELPAGKYTEMVRKAQDALRAMCWRGGIVDNCAGSGLSPEENYYIKRPHNYLFQALLALALDPPEPGDEAN